MLPRTGSPCTGASLSARGRPRRLALSRIMPQGDDLPLPDDPALAAVARALEDAGQWAEIYDHEWRYAYVTTDFRSSMGGIVEKAPIQLGAHAFGTEAVDVRRRWR